MTGYSVCKTFLWLIVGMFCLCYILHLYKTVRALHFVTSILLFVCLSFVFRDGAGSISIYEFDLWYLLFLLSGQEISLLIFLAGYIFLCYQKL